ncbi:S phase cyclin A-associated protein in the endoplasmic reticulum [Liparis tanakae]|uniref:S phase cyclin A-associated protein in the endoplasmic reticulum n=1 Tax=Liparis tanakae TaxID=230148 RepID=A0A4Z2GU16_9TELE|nr:S phase cyclin A-associated protein in the endoplasmic reticulum [Liparis tanakae]
MLSMVLVTFCGRGPPPTLAAARLSHTGPSWADRVKCTQFVPSSSQPTTAPVEKLGKKDAEGWETVQRGRTTKPRSAAIVAKVSPVVVHDAPKQDGVSSHLPPTEEQQLDPLSDKDTNQKDAEQPVPAEPDPLEEVGCPGNGNTTEPPAESAHDSGQCVDAPCGDAPPPIRAPTPSQAPEPPPPSATGPSADITLSVQAPAPALSTSSDLPQTDGLGALSAFGDSVAEGGASQGTATSAPGQAETPVTAVKLESVSDPTELSTVNEIAFINTLEAQNKRHDALAKLNEYEQRLNELQDERQRRQEEKQARDEAVQERKRVLEAERQARVEELLMRRKEQETRIEQQKHEKEKAREDAARERARAAQQEAMEELQKKIQLKHDESSRRHMEQIEQRKEKAAELSSGRHANTDYTPKLTPYERNKQCSLCCAVITSEVHLFSHTKGKRHQQAVRDSSSIQGRELSDEEVEHLSLKKYIVDIVPDSSVSSESMKDGEERQKARKKAKKLRARMNSRAKEYERSMEAKTQVPESPYKAKLQRLVKDLLKQLQGQDSGQSTNNKVSGLDRTLGEISRILEKQMSIPVACYQFTSSVVRCVPVCVAARLLTDH